MAAIRTAPSQCAALVAALALFAPFAVRAQTTIAPAEASRHFDRGYLLAQQGSLEDAIEEFKLAYALQPHASVLYNLGQAYAASGRAVEAIAALERFLTETPATDTQRRSHAASLIEYQGQRVGSLTLSVSPPGAQISLDGVALEPRAAAAPIRLTAGWHSLSITLEGYEPRVEGLRVVGKVSTSLSLVLSKKTSAQVPVYAPPRPRLPSSVAYAKRSNAAPACSALARSWSVASASPAWRRPASCSCPISEATPTGAATASASRTTSEPRAWRPLPSSIDFWSERTRSVTAMPGRSG